MSRASPVGRSILQTIGRTALGGLVGGTLVGVPTAYSIVGAHTSPVTATAHAASRTAAGTPDEIGIFEADPADPAIGRSSDGLFYVDIHMNGKSVRCVIDTGASTIVLSGAQAAKIGLLPSARSLDAHVVTVAGRVHAASNRLDSVELAGRSFDNVPALVVQAGDTPCLLGQDFLARLDRLEISGDEMHLQ